MAKSGKQRLKLLYIRDFLRQNTDEAHPASTRDILAFLESKGIHAERKSIYEDLLALEDYGMELHRKHGRGGGCYVAQRDFALSELKLLVDAVLSSRFLSPQQSAALIRKLASLSSEHEAELLRREIRLSGRIKGDGNSIFPKIDLLHEAIGAGVQITFRYFDWGVDLRKRFRPGIYRASPYSLLWDDENYYLIAHSEKYGLTHYRVDKLEELTLTQIPRTVTDELRAFDPGAYSREVFGMFRGERKQVKLRFENALAGVVVDRFGRDILLIPDGKEHFTLAVQVAASPNFFAWVASFAGRAAIVFPTGVVADYRAFCEKALAAME